MIPKIIHYCWLSTDPVPEDLQLYMSSWRKFLPDYEFKKWDFSIFDKTSSRWVSEAFDNKKYAFAADYIRLFAVYNYGGIYLDMDIEVIRKFDSLLNQSQMFATENPSDQLMIEAGCFGAEKGDEFIGKCLEYYHNRPFIKQDGSFATIPLPQIMKKIILDNNFNISTYSCDYFTCKSYQTGKITTTNHTYAIHHFAGSWLSEEQQRMNEQIQKLSGWMGYFVARNIVEFKFAFKNGNALGLLQKKIRGKARKKK